MNYNSTKSAKLTLAITFGFCAVLLVMMFTLRSFLLWYLGHSRPDDIRVLLIAFYTCCPAAWVALVSIVKLLQNIIAEEIFTVKNVRFMRILSWCCAYVSVVAFVCGCLSFPFFHFVSGLIYVAFFIVSLGAAFMMLILRVLKNVMAKATEIKNENELTI